MNARLRERKRVALRRVVRVVAAVVAVTWLTAVVAAGVGRTIDKAFQIFFPRARTRCLGTGPLFLGLDDDRSDSGSVSK